MNPKIDLAFLEDFDGGTLYDDSIPICESETKDPPSYSCIKLEGEIKKDSGDFISEPEYDGLIESIIELLESRGFCLWGIWRGQVEVEAIN